ncbi:Actin-like 6A [Nowakowskiella sp. JEL0407]|nr:Actin-like 6A [Nowakowskiella sp. JEL0407]
MIYGGDEVSALVLDVGKECTKFGYAGEDLPRAVFASDVGYLQSKNDGVVPMDTEDPSSSDAPTTAVKRKSNTAIGETELFWRENIDVKNPYGQNNSSGLIEDWDAFEDLLDYAYATRLRLNPVDHPLLICEPSWSTKEHREKIAEIMFEKYNVPALYLGRSAVLSAFSAGKPTALVLDSGAGFTSAVPVFDGYVIKKSIQKQPIAGDFLSSQAQLLLQNLMDHRDIVPHYLVAKKIPYDLTMQSKSLLNERKSVTSASFHEFAVKKVLLEFKELVCTTLRSNDRVSLGQIPPKSFEFPDGLNFMVADRWKVPEVLFQPNLTLGNPDPTTLHHTPLPALLNDTINSCDVDLRPSLYSNILVTGGSTLFPDFTKRLEMELMHVSARLKISAASGSAERRFGAWIGGSVLGSLGTFHQLWVGKGEWEEGGASGLEKRWH